MQMKRCKYCAAVLVDSKCPNETCIAFERAEAKPVKKKKPAKEEVTDDERD